jgi:protoheme IX farnesyltransferase
MIATLARAHGIAQARALWLLGLANDYYELGKPRIMYLLLITTAAAMVMAARGIPSLPLLFWTMLGGALAAMSAGTLNCVYDVDIDRLMRRTASRPLPAGRISIFAASTHACVMGVLSFAIFYFRVGHLAAWLSLAGNVYYVVIYTMLLKRRTPQNIVIGGAAGSVPPLVGWAAVTQTIGWPAAGLFAIIFLWTPPHFWALALMTETDYGKAGVPMLPNVFGAARTKRDIVIYTAVLLLATLLLYVPLHVMGAFYAACALVLGTVFLVYAIRTLRDETQAAARATFFYSLLYLALICAAMVIDRVFF